MLSDKVYKIVGFLEVLFGVLFFRVSYLIFAMIFFILVGFMHMLTPKNRINKLTDWSIKILFLIIGLGFLGSIIVPYFFTGDNSIPVQMIILGIMVLTYIASLILMIIGLIMGNKS